MITVDQIVCFKLTYELQSYSKAAFKLTKARSNVREKVNALEDIIGSELFETSGKKLVPTEIAHYLYPRANNLAKQISDFEVIATSFLDTTPKRITILHEPLIPLSVLAKIDIALQEHYPNMSIDWLERNREDSHNLLKRGDADFSIMPTKNRMYPPSQFGSHNLGPIIYSGYVDKDSPLADRPLSSIELSNELLFVNEIAVNDALVFTKLANDYHVVTNQMLIMEKLKYGGWTILSEGNAQPYLDRGLIKKLDVIDVSKGVSIDVILHFPLSSESNKHMMNIKDLICNAM